MNTSARLSSQARLSVHASQVVTRAMSELGNRKPSAALESLLFSRHKSLCLTWVTEWKGRLGSGTHQLEVALSQRRGSAAFMPARCSFSPHKRTLLARLLGPGQWLSTALGAAWVFVFHTTYHSLSESPRPGNPGSSKGYWSLDWKTHFGYGISCCLHSWVLKQKAKLKLLGHHISALCQARMFSSCLGSNVAKLLGEGRGKRSRQGKSSPGYTLGMPEGLGGSSDAH